VTGRSAPAAIIGAGTMGAGTVGEGMAQVAADGSRDPAPKERS
jgi:hypothetical protein